MVAVLLRFEGPELALEVGVEGLLRLQFRLDHPEAALQLRLLHAQARRQDLQLLHPVLLALPRPLCRRPVAPQPADMESDSAVKSARLLKGVKVEPPL